VPLGTFASGMYGDDGVLSSRPRTVVEIFSTQMSTTGSGLDLKDSLFNSKKLDIECTATKIKNEEQIT
jgi:hypothetical protein